jgi:hypothetical protein
MSGWTDEQKQRRMARDAAMILHPDRWPLPFLFVKSQPWVTEAAGGRMRSGRLEREDLLTVHTEDGTVEIFGSIEQLVEMWSVD